MSCKLILNRFVLSLFLICSAQVLLFGQTDRNNPAVLIEVDKKFSEFSVTNGFAKAFIQFADDSAIKMINNHLPVIGKQALNSRFVNIALSNHNTLSWQPLRAEIAQSGDLGYTFGNYQLRIVTENAKDSVQYGNYVTIWKKQKDGSWKYVLDGGNATPPPR